MANFRTDQFDNIPQNIDRVGAHRGPKVRGRGWIGFMWAVLATAVLIVGGLYVLSLENSSIKFFGNVAAEPTDTPTSSPTPEITPITDPASIKKRHITVTVLNGTDINGTQQAVGKLLKGDGWKVTSEANASESTIKTTTVYYTDAVNKDVAEGIQLALGTGTIELTSTNIFPGAPITVVIGSDYTG
jgi:hypothetical protein